jgi:hypothetical protein
MKANFVSYNPKETKCKVCGDKSELYDVVDLNRVINLKNYPFGLSGIPIYYYRCVSCQLVFTKAFDQFSSEDWTNIIYNDEYYKKIDLAYEKNRTQLNIEIIQGIKSVIGIKNILGIDYGGGNGLLSRILQQRNIDYHTYDPFGETDIIDDKIGNFNLISSFEVLEHLTDPLSAFDRIVELATDKFILILSTQCSEGLLDESNRLANWNYVSPRNGHVTIFTKKAFISIAKKYSMQYVSVSRGLHLFGKQINLAPLKYAAGLVKLKQKITSKFH